MASKKELLNNLREYTSDQIADAIKAGTVTMYELSKSGNLTPMMKKRLESKLAGESSTNTENTSVNISAKVETVSVPDSLPTPLMDKKESNDEFSELVIPVANVGEMCIPEPHRQVTETPHVKTPQTNYDVIDNKGSMFKRPFSFKGRIRRMEYFFTILIAGFVNVIMQEILTSVSESSSDAMTGALVVYCIFLVLYCWFVCAQNTKRCHDRGNSGWFQIIPFYGLWMLFADGEKGTNKYGNNPKN